jgi:two-component system OmpR family response regulator
MRVLLVEDDPMLGEALTQALRDASYVVDWLVDGRTASTALERHDYEIVLLDLGLPKRDGLDVLAALRAGADATPVLIITARDAVEQRIAGLDRGGDDYLVKPFATGELLARMRALTRRRAGQASPLMSNGPLVLDPATKIATGPNGEQVLSSREFALLRELLQRPGAVLSRSELEARIYGSAQEIESNVIEFIIHSLRRKLGAQAIRNVRGLGWAVDRPGATGGPA